MQLHLSIISRNRIYDIFNVAEIVLKLRSSEKTDEIKRNHKKMFKKRIFDSAVFWQVITFNSPEVVFLIRNRILFFPGASDKMNSVANAEILRF